MAMRVSVMVMESAHVRSVAQAAGFAKRRVSLQAGLQANPSLTGMGYRRAMRVDTHILRAGETLPHDLRQAWQGLRDDRTASPYFAPGYAEAVASVGAPVRVAVTGRDTPEALIALQGGRTARPAGAPVSDYHGIIGGADTEAFLQAAGVEVLGVNGWIGAGDGLEAAPVCRIDLSGGFKAWRDSRDSSYSRHAKSGRRRARKAAEEVGELRCDWRTRNVDVFNQLVAWKRAQYASTGKYDVLAAWPGDLIRRLWEVGTEDVRAEMHALWFGDRLASVDLGLTDGRIFHSWIVAYDPDLASYSPGILLLEALVEAAGGLGYTTLDLGVGLDGYKRHYANVDAVAGVGVIRTAGARAQVSRLYGAMEPKVELLARLRRRYTQVAACEPVWSGRLKAMGAAVGANLSAGSGG